MLISMARVDLDTMIIAEHLVPFIFVDRSYQNEEGLASFFLDLTPYCNLDREYIMAVPS